MKVAQITSYLDPARGGGLGGTVVTLATALGSRPDIDCRVFCLATPESDRVAPEMAADECRVIGPRSFGYAPGLLPSLDRVAPDLVHLHGLWTFPSLVAWRWSRRRRKPRIISPQGMLDHWALQRSPAKKRLARLAFENDNLHGAACLHAVSEAEAMAMRQLGLRNPIAIVPNMAEAPAAHRPRPPAWKASLPPGARVLLFLGRLHPKKGLAELVAGWAALGDRRRAGWHLAIAGWDEVGIQGSLKTAAAELGVNDTVHFIGPQTGSAKSATFAHSDAFILPSHSEGMPVAVLEAWAHGLPVVMTEACNLPAGFTVGAALATEVEPAAIGHALGSLLAMDDATRWQMGQAGCSLVQERYGPSRVAAAMCEVYRWILGDATRPSCVDASRERRTSKLIGQEDA